MVKTNSDDRTCTVTVAEKSDTDWITKCTSAGTIGRKGTIAGEARLQNTDTTPLGYYALGPTFGI